MWTAWLLAGGLAIQAVVGEEGKKMQQVALSDRWEEWTFQAQGQFTGWSDRRGLFSMRHPFAESHTGDYAQVSREVRVPEDWTGPIFLSLLATDSHHGVGYDPAQWPHYVGADIFVGHRFKQVLVDGETVWEQDVADSDSPGWKQGQGQPPYEGFYTTVDLSDRVKPGQSFRLTLRVFDRVGSGEPLPGDVHQAHYWEPADLDRREANRWFDFTAWWGDVCLTSDPRGVQTTFDERISLLPRQPVRPEAPQGIVRVELPIRRAETLPEMPYPLWGGVPFPRGLVRQEQQIRLRDEAGQEVPSQVRILSRWPEEGSVQWAWINVMAQPGQKRLVLECGPEVRAREWETPLRVSQEEGKVTVETGQVALTLSSGGIHLLDSLRLPGGPECGPVTGILHQQMLGYRRTFQACPQELTVEEEGPVRASVGIRGELRDGEGNRFGRFTARLWAWRDCPLVSLSFRIFQETDQRVAIVDDLLLQIATPFSENTRGSFSRQTFEHPVPEGQVRELELRQPRTGTYDSMAQAPPQEYGIFGKRAETLESGRAAPGWCDVRGSTPNGQSGGLAAGVRWFWQQSPKSLTVTPEGLLIGLFARRQRDDWALDSPLWMMTRGEAKRHQVWLWPHDGQAPAALLEQLQKAWDARPHLMNGEWIAASGVLGNFARHDETHFPEVDRWLRTTWDRSELAGVRYGIRDFRETAWCQNYRGRAANGLLEYFASGRPEWQDYFEQVMGHHLDVDTIHFEPEHPDWIGAIRDYSPYHTTGGPSHGINTNCQDQFLHYFFVGEPDSGEEARRAADYIARLGGDQGRSARQEGWPMAQMSLAYLWTGDPRYREAARQFFHFAHRYTHPRRGAYEELHSSFSHRGIVPFMTGYLGFGLIRYHQATGDEAAARLLIALSEATVSETGDGQGGFWYSPCPTQRQAGSHHWSALIGGMLAYCYRLTGDPWFAQQARQCYDKLIHSDGIGLDMAPLLGELLAGLEAAS